MMTTLKLTDEMLSTKDELTRVITAFIFAVADIDGHQFKITMPNGDDAYVTFYGYNIKELKDIDFINMGIVSELFGTIKCQTTDFDMFIDKLMDLDYIKEKFIDETAELKAFYNEHFGQSVDEQKLKRGYEIYAQAHKVFTTQKYAFLEEAIDSMNLTEDQLSDYQYDAAWSHYSDWYKDVHGRRPRG